MKNKITATLIALGMALGIGVPTAAAVSGYGLTATPQTPWTIGSVYGTAHVSGTATANVGVSVRLLKNGVQKSMGTWNYTKGSYYNGNINVSYPCSTGTWVTQVKIGGGTWASSPGKFIPCL
jgi:hypothetical protein